MIRPLHKSCEYEFLEVSYVYGIMDGEAVHKNEQMERKDDIIRLI